MNWFAKNLRQRRLCMSFLLNVMLLVVVKDIPKNYFYIYFEFISSSVDFFSVGICY
jgi:hypothetical protein